MGEKEQDAYMIHVMSEKGLYLEPLWIKEHRARMDAIWNEYQYNLTAEIPTWMDFKTFRVYNKYKQKRIKRIKYLRRLIKIKRLLL